MGFGREEHATNKEDPNAPNFSIQSRPDGPKVKGGSGVRKRKLADRDGGGGAEGTRAGQEEEDRGGRGSMTTLGLVVRGQRP